MMLAETDLGYQQIDEKETRGKKCQRGLLRRNWNRPAMAIGKFDIPFHITCFIDSIQNSLHLVLSAMPSHLAFPCPHTQHSLPFKLIKPLNLSTIPLTPISHLTPKGLEFSSHAPNPPSRSLPRTQPCPWVLLSLARPLPLTRHMLLSRPRSPRIRVTIVVSRSVMHRLLRPQRRRAGRRRRRHKVGWDIARVLLLLLGWYLLLLLRLLLVRHGRWVSVSAVSRRLGKRGLGWWWGCRAGPHVANVES